MENINNILFKRLGEPINIEKDNFEIQYAKSLLRILKEGSCQNTRSGETISVQHQYFLLKDVGNYFPVLHGKKMFPKLALKELMWFLNGRTDIKWLEERGVKYWHNWMLEDGTIGTSYGKQFRNFNGVDQVVKCLQTLLNNPHDRCININLLNVAEFSTMALRPCVYDYQFSCIQSENGYDIDLHVTQRSGDSFLGVPYDFCVVGWMLNIFCEILNRYKEDNNIWGEYKARDIHYTIHDYHMYTNHEEQVKQYINNCAWNKNNCLEHPVVFYNKTFFGQPLNKDLSIALTECLEIFDNSDYKHFKLTYETPYPKIKAEVSI